MAKRVQLVLNENIRKLGTVGEVVEVAPGYARNYLLPKGLAYHATPGVLKLAERRREEERKRQEALRQEALKQKETIEQVGTLQIARKAGEEDTLFGSVTSSDVAELIQSKAGVEVDRRSIDLPEIRKLGTYSATLKLHAEVVAAVNLEVVAEE
ncbi:50S ribosomal protein L9 [Lyngbya confervoides]|uniref:Large ribosomal subunit protein bL9 n=1 Tax=Lyngbya confervoides BDU141951 TaxID=1574623 RepID=A0ABD4T662_9CYAN|nr:50S ribosomal protein L9 [Lyngbya confervoides]MCM1983725.1 50S ribosomal protein L9 [Lyngbya confervoides BDU141951]